jgi:hypothetical protein
MTVFTFSDNLDATVVSSSVLQRQFGDALVTFVDGLDTYLTEVRPGGSVLDSVFIDNLDRGTEEGAGGASIFRRVLQDTGYRLSNENLTWSVPGEYRRSYAQVQVLVESLSATVSVGDGWVRGGAFTQMPGFVKQPTADPTWTGTGPTTETWSNISGAQETWVNVTE